MAQKRTLHIAAICCQHGRTRAIGFQNDLLFRLKQDMQHFKRTTAGSGKAVVMGANTFLSLPQEHRPLRNRVNLILSNTRHREIQKLIQHQKLPQTYVFNSLQQSVQFSHARNDIDSLFIIGGQRLYEQALRENILHSVHLSTVQTDLAVPGDTFFPTLPVQYEHIRTQCVQEQNVLCLPLRQKIDSVQYDITEYKNTQHKWCEAYGTPPELEYLNTIEDVLLTGEERQTRNSLTKSKFGLRLEFDLDKGFPLLTTKKVYWKGVVEELLWFLRGGTDARDLQQKKVHIWDKNSERTYLDSIGLQHYQEGWCGPIYGYQWRYFNAPYRSPTELPQPGEGVDQLQQCIDLIRHDPASRRIFMTAWNPVQLSDMVLPPCHVSYQFFVTETGHLDCQMYQRSADLFLGLPFNIASTSLLTHLLATHCGLDPGRVIVCVGDGHIYENHVSQIQEQLSRTPYAFPCLKYTRRERLEDYVFKDFELQSYYSHPSLKADMIA